MSQLSYQNPPKTLSEFKRRLKQTPMQQFDPGHLIQNPNRTTNGSGNRISDYVVLYTDESGLQVFRVETHFQRALGRWADFRESCRNGYLVGMSSFGRRSYNRHPDYSVRREEERRVSLVRAFWDRILAGLARRNQLDLVWVALGLWKERVEQWLENLDPDDGKSWAEDLLAYEMIHETSWGMLTFFMELRSESIETRIWKHLEVARSEGSHEVS
jgi:hypothetical protein